MKHHTELRSYRIYALVQGEEVFVGATQAARASAVYSRHKTQSVSTTREWDWGDPPSMHILETAEATGSDAYRHVLVWIRRFEDEGFICVNHERTCISADWMYPKTEEIYRNLPKAPMAELLEKTRLNRPADGDRNPKKAGIFQPKTEKNIQMNLRMSPEDHAVFRRFCKHHKLRSRDAVGLLLDQAEGNDTHLKQIQQAYAKELEVLRRTYEKQSNHKEERAREFLSFLQPGLSDYLRWIPTGTPLPAMPYKQFKRQVPLGVHYDAPREEGFLLLNPEWILYGRSRSKFIVGRGINGEYLRLRRYDRPFYAGIEVQTKGWWMVGCKKASDGAMEIAAAFPMPPLMEYSKEETPLPRKPSLDDLILAAQK